MVATVSPGGPQLRVEEVPLVRLLAGVPGSEGQAPDVGHVVVSHGQLPAHPGPASPYTVWSVSPALALAALAAGAALSGGSPGEGGHQALALEHGIMYTCSEMCEH